ncbi:MAG: DNA primase [Lachnospiraceae bacterium]
MYYSDDLIEEVRAANDVVDVISSYVKLTKKGSSYFGLCPFHNEKSPSFSVSPGKQMYYCFGCGEGGNTISFIMKYENYTFQEAVKYLADRAGIRLPEVEATPEEKRKAGIKSVILDINKEAALYFYKLLKSGKGQRGYEYLKARGLSDDTIKAFGLGYSSNYKDDLYRYMRGRGYDDNILKETGLFTFSERGVFDKFSNRVMFPIMDVNSRVIGFGGRVMGEGEPKYLNSPETLVFDKGKNLYGMNIARMSKKGSILICEGYMDVISLHQAGFDNAVASLGTALTSRQASLIKRYSNNVYLTYDSDGAGVKAALRAIPIFKEAGCTLKVINMKPYKDPDEFIKNKGAEAYEERIEKARNSFLYEIDRMKENTDMDSPDAKASFYIDVARKLLSFSDELERNVYIDTVSREFFIPREALEQSVRQQALTYKGEDSLKRQADYDNKKREKKTPEEKINDGIKTSQRLLLTWLIEEPELYEKIKGIVGADDFEDEIYHKAAGMIIEQLENGEKPTPAKVVNLFTDEEEHKVVASLFNTQLAESLKGAEKEKAVTDTVRKVKDYSLTKAIKAATDGREMQRLMMEHSALKTLFIHLY